MSELKKVFRPELLNRIDEVIVFHKLEKAEILEVVDLMMKRVREEMAKHDVVIELTDEARELLVEQGYDPAMGARPLRRAIQRMIEDPLADFILGRELTPGLDDHRRPPREPRRGRAAGRDPGHRGHAGARQRSAARRRAGRRARGRSRRASCGRARPTIA